MTALYALERAGLYLHALRHLRPVQVYGRLAFRMSRPQPELRPAPPLRARSGRWVAPAMRRQSQLDWQEFRFLNETRTIQPAGWDDPAIAKLWRYNLHYFDDLNAEGGEQRHAWHEALIELWIAENPPGQGTGWEPYPTSLRIVNWIKWALAGNALPAAAIESLAVQARWLVRRLEHHLLGNHLFANAKALVFAGLFFDGREADSWVDRGMAILAREVQEQILPDGEHFELSTMYHALALEDLCDLLNAANSYQGSLPERWTSLVAGWPATIGAMRAWLATMCHPDGEIAFFNDAAFGIAPTPAELEAYGARLGMPPKDECCCPLTWLQDSGYIRLKAGPAVALLDVARIGPDYLPGHAHADTLSFELSVHGRRILVNSGTSLYGAGAERLRQRGTAAHNTVIVGGRDSSEVWSSFRVGRRARPQGLTVSREDGLLVECAHSGYRRLPGAPVHSRIWQLRGDRLLVTDRVTGGSCDAESRFHFHPSVVPEIDEAGWGRASVDDGTVIRWRSKGGEARIEETSYYPEFGLSLPTSCLTVPLRNAESTVEFCWSEL